MWLSLARASILIRADLDTVMLGAPWPALKREAVYGPCTLRSMPHCWKLASLSVSDSRHTLNVNPEQSPPSPPVAGSLGGSFGESSQSLSFQHPPSCFLSTTTGGRRCLTSAE